MIQMEALLNHQVVKSALSETTVQTPVEVAVKVEARVLTIVEPAVLAVILIVVVADIETLILGIIKEAHLMCRSK